MTGTIITSSSLTGTLANAGLRGTISSSSVLVAVITGIVERVGSIATASSLTGTAHGIQTVDIAGQTDGKTSLAVADRAVKERTSTITLISSYESAIL